MARLTLARKIAAITLTIWKKGVSSTQNSCVGKQFEHRWLKKAFPSLGVLFWGGQSSSGDARFEGSISQCGLACVPRHRVTHYTLCPLG